MRKPAFYLSLTATVSLALAGGAGLAMGATPSGAPAQPAPSTCAAQNIKADLNAQPTGNRNRALLAVTNTGDQTCTLQGTPDVGFLAANNSPVPVNVDKVNQPGPGPRIELEPGQSAFGGVKWTPCDKGDADCAVATTVEITSPGATEPVVADFHSANGGGERVTELALSSAQVGTLQPITDGVVAW